MTRKDANDIKDAANLILIQKKVSKIIIKLDKNIARAAKQSGSQIDEYFINTAQNHFIISSLIEYYRLQEFGASSHYADQWLHLKITW